MLGHRLRRWPSIKPLLNRCLVLTGVALVWIMGRALLVYYLQWHTSDRISDGLGVQVKQPCGQTWPPLCPPWCGEPWPPLSPLGVVSPGRPGVLPVWSDLTAPVSLPVWSDLIAPSSSRDIQAFPVTRHQPYIVWARSTLQQRSLAFGTVIAPVVIYATCPLNTPPRWSRPGIQYSLLSMRWNQILSRLCCQRRLPELRIGIAVRSQSLTALLCRAKRQHLLTCKVSRFCLLALHGRAVWSPRLQRRSVVASGHVL